jgi:hypothetical protein
MWDIKTSEDNREIKNMWIPSSITDDTLFVIVSYGGLIA